MKRAVSVLKAAIETIQRAQDRLAPPMAWRWPILVLAGLLSGLCWTLLGQLVQSQNIRLTLAALGELSLWLTALFWGLAVLAVTFLSHSLWAGNLVVGVPSLLLAFVNYFKEMITSTPLTVGDFTLIRQIWDIADMSKTALTLSRNSILAIVGAALWLIVTGFFSRPLRVRWRWSLLGAPASALAFFLLFWVGVNPLVFSPLDVYSDIVISQVDVNRSCGVPLGLWRSLYKTLMRGMREDYSPEYMEEVVNRAEDYAEGTAAPTVTPADVPELKQPNIILVLSESFFDLTRLSGVTFDEDPVADFHALQQEGVSGIFYTRSLGTGTCNVELEIMTGINTGLLLNEDLYSLNPEVFSNVPAVPALLRDNGYYTSMTHTYNDSTYHRKEFFPNVGFEDLFFSGDFAKFYPPAAEADNYYGFMVEHYLSGGFYSDDLMSNLLIAQYEAMSATHDGPLFMYAITIENHGPYPGKYSESELTVRPISDLTGEAAESLLQYSKGTANASAALGKLADYFRECDEPTVIVFFGDHRPGLGLSSGGTVYSELGLVSASSSQWSLEDVAELYSTDCLIWSNDLEYLPGEPGGTLDTSCNYLGALLLDIAGVEKPTYWKLISRLSQYRLIDAERYHLSTAGELTASVPDSGEAAEGLSLLTDILGNVVYGNQNVTDLIGSSAPE